jgi:hypothetical protein
MGQITSGADPVTFDERGASVEGKHPPHVYRVPAETATNARDVLKYHRPLCFA